MSLFRNTEGCLDEADVNAAQALADVATIGILQHRAALETKVLNTQLSRAPESRIVIEQAKGVVGERSGLTMEQAFCQMRGHARNHNVRLLDLARAVVDGTMAPVSLDPLRSPMLTR